MLIEPNTLFENLSNPEIRIFDCRFSLPGPKFDPDYGQRVYQQGHIPGAIYVDLEKDLAATPGADDGRHPFPPVDDFLKQLKLWGVHPDSSIIIYDDSNAMMAARLWWMLRYWVGIEDIKILNGGFSLWTKKNLPIDTEIPQPTPSSHSFSVSSAFLKSTDDIRLTLIEKDHTLVDARARARFTGDEENIDPVAGHIPGAINLPCSDNVDTDGTFLSVERLKQRFEPLVTLAGNPNKVIHSCGSGITACHNIFAMEQAGYPGAKLYAGSWSEWIRHPENPIATGE